MFSVILPTRERLPGLKKTLDSFQNTTDNLNGLEVILVCDTDDESLHLVEKVIDKYPYNIMALVRPRSDHFCRDYQNWGASKSSGQNILCWNDDCWVKTPHWDTIIKEKVGTRRVYMVDCMDSTHEELYSFPRFPIISRAAYEAAGSIYYPQIRMWGADRVIYDLYKAADCIIKCHEVWFQHDHLPSKRFYDIYAEDYRNKVFPVDILNEVEALKKAKEKYDGSGVPAKEV
jgi:glycosyltransferase involved in cell wall biosynthesis